MKYLLIVIFGFSVSLILPIKAVIGLPLPHINQHQSYRELRTKLIDMGWQPVNFSPSERYEANHSEWANVISQREKWQELEMCTPTGAGFCRFVFQDELGNKLIIITYNNQASIPIKRRHLIDNWMYEPIKNKR